MRTKSVMNSWSAWVLAAMIIFPPVIGFVVGAVGWIFHDRTRTTTSEAED